MWLVVGSKGVEYILRCNSLYGKARVYPHIQDIVYSIRNNGLGFTIPEIDSVLAPYARKT